MSHAANVPDLHEDRAAVAMDFVGYPPPALFLRFVVDTRRHRVSVTGRKHVCDLTDDQACTGALSVIGGDERIRDVAYVSPCTCHRGHDDAIF
jgi:hypothetical protein